MDKTNIQENTLLYFVLIFLKYWKIILVVVSIFAVITAFIVYFVMDPIFKSEATLKSTGKETGLSSLMNLQGLPGIGEFSELTGGGTAKELSIYENILISRRCIEPVIINFNLNTEWKYKYFEDAIKFFRENVMEIKKDKIAGTMSITIYDKYPSRAKEIIDTLISRLNIINTELNVLSAKNNRMFIEKRFVEVSSELKRSEDSLRVYQDTYGVAPDLQIQASLKAEIELESQVKSEEIKLDILRKILSPDQSEIRLQEDKINSLKKHLSEIQNSSYEENKLNMKNVPIIVMNYYRLKRDVEIKNKIMTTLIPLLEQSKIEEKRNTPVVLVLDYPSIAEKKSKPQRVLTILAVSVFVGFLTFVLFVLYNKWLIFRKKLLISSDNE